MAYFNVEVSPCCGLLILDNFWDYLATEDDFGFGEPNYKHKWCGNGKKELIGHLKDTFEQADVEPCSQLLITLLNVQDRVIGSTLRELGFKKVVHRALSKKSGNEISTYIKVMHPKAKAKKKVVDKRKRK